MNKLEIEIPEGKEIDWQESAKQEKIVFKEKQLTYNDVCKKLFKNGYCYIDTDSSVRADGCVMQYTHESTNAKTTHQLECILAKNKLANVARYLNGKWKEYEDNHSSVYKYIIWYNLRTDTLVIDESHNYVQYTGNIIFKSKELAKQAIEILGEKAIKLALEPLY